MAHSSSPVLKNLRMIKNHTHKNRKQDYSRKLKHKGKGYG